jgi:hypothetical protein
MPKENTHLHFAYGLLDELQDHDIRTEVSENIRHYLLGSIIPDTCYYGSSASLRHISESFHGKDGNPTNTTIVQVLDNARDKKDISFILGFISHCALDITFHPVIYYLSGNYYDESPRKRARAVYLHRHLETCLDLNIKNSMRLHRLIRVKYLEGLVFEEIISQTFKVPVKSLRHSLRRQIIYNVLFTINAVYHLARLASKTGLFKDASQLGLFYGDAGHDEQLPPIMEVADLIDGRQWTTTTNELFSNARTLAKSMMEAAYGYWMKSLTRDEMLQAIPGVSLDTGRLGMSASSIRHTKGDSRLKEG